MELDLVAGTRAALGFGLGLLLAGRLSQDQRRTIGWTLFLVGLVSTIPLAVDIIGRSESSKLRELIPGAERGST
jgi:hypothetical protein